jgi:hypothetical protein
MKVARFIKPLTVAFDQAVFEEIKRITDAERISMGAWVREAVDESLEKYQPQGNAIEDKK